MSELVRGPEELRQLAAQWLIRFWDLADRTSEELLAASSPWLNALAVVRATREELSQFRNVQPAKEYVIGEGFYYLGRKYRLKLIDDAPAAELRLHAGRFLPARDRADQGRADFIRWYTDHAQPWLADRVATLQDRVAVKPKGVQVRDLGYRWASCGQGGKLYFHWRAILLPPPRIEYLVLHELCHLHQHDHSPAFYQRLRRAAPNYQNHDIWLRAHGDDYRL